MKKQQILHVQYAFLYNLQYEQHPKKFPFATLFGGHKHRDKFNFFAESERGCGPQDPVWRVDRNKREKVKKKTKNAHSF